MKKHIFIIAIISILISLTFSGCIEEKGTEDKSESGEILYQNLKIQDLEISTEIFPNISSSTSAHPLAVLIGCKILNISYVWTNDVYYPYYGYVYPENYIVPNASETDKEYIVENITYKVNRGGTHGSFVGLIEGNYSLIITARLPSEEELLLANNKSVQLISKPVALDAFVFILNENNNVNNLTTEQIQKIYTGEITNWSDVGGNETWNIIPYQRNKNSGSQELMETLVMKNLEMIDSRDLMANSMSGPYNLLSREKKGIAYTVYYYKQFMANNFKNIKLCGVDSFYPNYDNIFNKLYPYTTDVYVVIRNDLDPTSPSYKIRDWLLGEEGQDIVKESGYVPISE
jgi:phosphate transport system substrate-binding protein